MRPFSDWTREELLAYITSLHGDTAVKGTRKRPGPIKAAQSERTFDFSRYHERYVAFKFAYLGWHYNGLVTQEMPTELPTVEEEIFKALMKTKLISHPDACRFSRCGRTDKGVSAMGQVMALNVRSARLQSDDETKDVKELPWVQQLNGCLPQSIRILAYDDTISQDFDARFSCKSRHYKYLLAPRIPGLRRLDITAMQEACKYLVGEHDFRNFCKLDASKQISNFHRSILHCEISPFQMKDSDLISSTNSGLYVLDLKGSAFLWHQVRCITAILLLIGQGLETPELVQRLLDIKQTPTKPVYEMADDWPLTLYACDFGDAVNWKYPEQPQRTLESVFATMHEARIKDTIASFMVNECVLGDDEVLKNGTNLGNGRIKMQANYVPILQRPRLANVEIMNAAWLKKKQSKQAKDVMETE